ncbi:hypothetical protein BEL04_14570 [Mucilaginibacter sp. PPCGB 2223]|nr:hypothetical protein BEL04_14570 [Mucilaginibacter sp. PPCGB 2223]
MFAPILSAINMAGDGRAFNSTANGNGYALGGLFNGSNVINDGSNDVFLAKTYFLISLSPINLIADR